MLGQVSRRQPGCSVLSNQLLQQRRHTGRCRRHRPSRPIYWRAFRGTLALGVLLFVQGKKPAEDGSGFGIGQVDLTQIPESRAHVKALEMVVAGGDLKPDTLQTEGAVGAALSAIHFSREGNFEFGAAWTKPARVAVAEITMQRSLAQFGVDGPVVFHLDPGLCGLVQLIQSQISDSFEHRQQAPFDPVPKGLLFAILKRRVGSVVSCRMPKRAKPSVVSAASMAEPLSVIRARGKARF